MPEGDVRIGSLDTHISRRSFPYVLAGGAIVAFLVLRNKPMGMPGTDNIAATVAAAQQSSDQTSLEFQQNLMAAQLQLQQLAASSAIEQQQLNQQYQLAAGVNPGLQTQCIPLTTWYNLSQDITRNLVQQVRDGQLYMNIGTQGVCFAPTQQGIQGHPPIVKNTSGIFGGSAQGYASTVGQPTPPYLGQILPYIY
jgi:hypothetical protein